MAREKPLDVAVVQAWLAAWDESDVFSDAAVRRLLSLIADPFCLVVVTLGVDREPRSLVFRRIKEMIHVPISAPPALKPTLRPGKWENIVRLPFPSMFPSMPVSPVAPVAPSIGQLWHQTGVKSETVPRLERVLRWDGTDWAVAGLVYDNANISMQGMQVCDFNEALAYAHELAKWLDCEFIYTYDGSTRGNA
jgi:hypothetical protein